MPPYQGLTRRGAYGAHRARLAGKVGDHYRVEFRTDSTQEPTVVTATRIVLNPGARSGPPPIEGLNDIHYLDHHSILDLRELPQHLLVIGGSDIGLELGQIWARFGSRVTILQAGEQIMPQEDRDMADAAAEFLRDEGIEVRTALNGVTVGEVRLVVDADRDRLVGPAHALHTGLTVHHTVAELSPTSYGELKSDSS